MVIVLVLAAEVVQDVLVAVEEDVLVIVKVVVLGAVQETAVWDVD